MPKNIIFNETVRQRVKDGVSKLAAAVKVTLGPSGKVVLYAREYSDPIFTKDGVTVAKEVELEDYFENMGAQIVRQATSKTASLAGDGTTTATIYAEKIFEAGLKHIANGAKVQEIKYGIELAVRTISDGLKAAAHPVVDTAQLRQVGICSANQDTEIGTTVADAIEKVGKDGIVTIEEGRSIETVTDLVDGFQFNRGYLNQCFATDQQTLRAEHEKPFILVTDQKIMSAKQILPLLERHMKSAESARGLIIIADEIEGEALAVLVVNHTRGAFKVVAVKAPDFGDRRRAQLEDIALMTGAKLISVDSGLKWEDVNPKQYGTCEKITIDRDTTTIINGGGNQELVAERIELLKGQIANFSSDFDRERAQERLARLAGGIARIAVGGATEAEMREKKDRIDDALHACKAAIAEGILPGGGISALFAARRLDKLKGLTDDQRLGVSIIKKAVEAPLRQIVVNTGEDDGPVLARITASKNPNFGYNAVTGKFGDMYKFGVIVPTLVELVALQNAASVAILLLSTDCMIAPIPNAIAGQPQIQGMGPMA